MTGTPGLLVTAALLVLLVLREALRAAWLGRGETRASLRVFDLALIPLLVAFVAVVVVRFDRLSL